jgi:hypothetical protein
MINLFKDHDVVRVTRNVEAFFLDEDKENITIQAGTTGAVINVLGNPQYPSCYQIEFYLRDQNDFAISTVDAEFVAPAGDESRETPP